MANLMINNTPEALRKLFTVAKDTTFLNHGGFGGTPIPVFERYQELQWDLERNPEKFLWRDLKSRLDDVRNVLGAYLHTAPGNLALVSNATMGLNIVARSLDLTLGDEILSTDQEYGAVDRMWRFLAKKSGSVYRTVSMTLPLSTHEQFVEEFWSQVTPSTKVIALSHSTSPTGLIFPLQEICRRAREVGIITIIDGAHAPSQIDLNLDTVGADFYTGNCHKWLSAPRGAAFLYARPDLQHLVEPLIVSWGFESEVPSGSTFQDYLGWTGTHNPCAYLVIPDAIKFQADHDWAAVRARCHNMVVAATDEINEITGLAPLHNDGDVWIGQMAAVRLPAHIDAKVMRQRFNDEHKMEVHIGTWTGSPMMRISVQGYNSEADLQRLVSITKTLL